MATTYAEIPFELEVDCPVTAEHLNYAVSRLNDLQTAYDEQHYTKGTRSGGHASSQIAVSTGKLIFPTGAAAGDLFNNIEDGVELRRIWGTNLTFSRMYFTPFDDQYGWQVVLKWAKVKVVAMVASVPPRNAATLIPAQACPVCVKGPLSILSPASARNGDGAWMIGLPRNSLASPQGDYLQFAAWGVRES
jgi:hypothetical protein